MYSKILVALDGARLAEGILPYVRRLAPALKAQVEFVHVSDPTQPASASQPLVYLEKIATSFAGIAETRCTVDRGNPARQIIELATAQPNTLIAMATHGFSGAKRWLLGSVAEKVVRAATNDLLLVRPAEDNIDGSAELETLLVPLDGSQLAEQALPGAAELARQLNLAVVLVRVTKHFYTAPPEAFVPLFGANYPNLKQLRDEDRADAYKYLVEQVAALRARGVSEVKPVLMESGVEGAAVELIELIAHTAKPIIALTTHGTSGFGPWLIGSVTERVVRHANAPVLVLRPQS
jgi:nucleotide-binding universal stress UspA family protein